MNSSSFNGYKLSALLILKMPMVERAYWLSLIFAHLLVPLDVSRASIPYCVYHNSKMMMLERTHHGGLTVLEYSVIVDVNQASILNGNQSKHFKDYDDSLIRLSLTTIAELLKFNLAVWRVYLIARFI